jgi:cysteine sulfinate desulfinase/cysteine desulfurase-like protein
MAAIGLPRQWGLGSLRITLGTGTRPEDIDLLVNALPGLVEQSRVLNRG